MAIIQSQEKDGIAIVKDVGSNTVYQPSQFATADDTALGLTCDEVHIRKVLWSVPQGEIVKISREVSPSNVNIFIFTMSGLADLDAMGIATSSPSDHPAANLI